MYNRCMKKIRQGNQERRYSGGEVRTMKEGQVAKEVRVFRRIHGYFFQPQTSGSIFNPSFPYHSRP